MLALFAELNPIELVWAKAKMRILRLGKHTRQEAMQSPARAMAEVTVSDLDGHYRK